MEFEIEERTILILELIQVEKNVKLYLKVMIATYILLLSLTFLNVSVGNIMIVTAVAIINTIFVCEYVKMVGIKKELKYLK